MKFKFCYTILFVLALGISCYSVKTDSGLKQTKTTNKKRPDTIAIANDSLDYKIIILEIGFSNWLATQNPRGYYSQQFLEIRNRQYVTEYNIRYMEPGKYSRDLYPFRIDYNFKTDYGYEVNYLLYHYFLFFEQKYNQKLRY